MTSNHEILLNAVPGALRTIARERCPKMKRTFVMNRLAEAQALIPTIARMSGVRDGNFTVVLIHTSDGKIYTGTAKRNPRDAYSEKTGAHIATVRALAAMLDENIPD